MTGRGKATSEALIDYYTMLSRDRFGRHEIDTNGEQGHGNRVYMLN